MAFSQILRSDRKSDDEKNSLKFSTSFIVDEMTTYYCYYAAVLMGHITGFARLSVRLCRPSVKHGLLTQQNEKTQVYSRLANFYCSLKVKAQGHRTSKYFRKCHITQANVQFGLQRREPTETHQTQRIANHCTNGLLFTITHISVKWEPHNVSALG